MNLKNHNMITTEIKKIVTPQEFLDLLKNKERSIKSSKFVAPKLGEQNFGKVIVTYKHGSRK